MMDRPRDVPGAGVPLELLQRAQRVAVRQIQELRARQLVPVRSCAFVPQQRGELRHRELHAHLDGAQRAVRSSPRSRSGSGPRSRRARWCAAAPAATRRARPRRAARRAVVPPPPRALAAPPAPGLCLFRGACDRSSGDAPCAQAIDGAAACDGDDPGDGAASSGIELRGAAPNFQERLLDDVLGLFPVPQDPKRDRDRPRRVLIVQAPQRGDVALGDAREKFPVARPDRSARWARRLRIWSSTLQYWVRQSPAEAAAPIAAINMLSLELRLSVSLRTYALRLSFTVEERPLRFPGGGRMSFKTFVKRLYAEYENDAVADSAAALSYYFVFALFPFLFFLDDADRVPAVHPALGRHVAGARATRSCPTQAIALIETTCTSWWTSPGRAC